MSKYVAFLRGINVGGHRSVTMDELSRAFVSLGFGNVRTHIQSGNVIFETASANRAALTGQIEKALRQLLGDEIAVFLRTIREIEDMIRLDPFKGRKADARAKLYVTFISGEPGRLPELPLFSPKKDVEVIEIRDRDVFSLSHMKNGRFGFPNSFIEREFGVSATTRNWTTITKVVA